MVGYMQGKNNLDSADRTIHRKFSKFKLDINRIGKLIDETLEKLTFAVSTPFCLLIVFIELLSISSNLVEIICLMRKKKSSY